MNAALLKRIGIVGLIGSVCVAMVFLTGAAPDTAGKSGAKYEYTTASSDVSSLQTELNKLGKEGWNVVSVLREDLTLAQENDGKNHIRTVQVTIVAKRPLPR